MTYQTIGYKQPRCRMALAVDGTVPWATRCRLKPGHNGPHEGRHLSELPYQKVKWFHGDGREFQSDRDRAFAWKTRKRG